MYISNKIKALDVQFVNLFRLRGALLKKNHEEGKLKSLKKTRIF